ncbi:hypothetical protein B0H10DRAFT_1954645 [Mycena sp. CBHHK59/15]|nr:hypothetical protein B0H10DRAFT_1954645 [Mycena sp. CBHHK59/15]
MSTHHSRADMELIDGLSTRVLDFMYIDSTEALRSFSEFIDGLGVKKIQDWWAHKEMNDWVIPCLVILPEHWDGTPATTNTGEAQHHWTNSLTGIKLTLVEGIESARRLDYDVVNEVRISTSSGVLLNSSNEMFHRLGRSSQRQSTAARKSRESDKVGERAAELQAKISGGKTLLKGYQAELKSLKGATMRSTYSASRKISDDTVIVSASSCGRVKTMPLPKTGKETSETPPAAPTLPTHADAIDVDIAGTPAAAAMPPTNANVINSTYIPAPSTPLHLFVPSSAPSEFPPPLSSSIPMFDLSGAGLPQFDNQFDFAFLGDSSYDFNFDLSLFGSDPAPTFALEFLGGSDVQSNFDWSAFAPSQDPPSVPPPPAPAAWGSEDQNFDWSALTPPQDLPLLPPPPASSPLYAGPAEPPVDDSAHPTRPRQDIDLEVNEKNILHCKQPRTL